MEQNMGIFGFELTKEDMGEILKLDTGNSVVISLYPLLDVTKWFRTLSE